MRSFFKKLLSPFSKVSSHLSSKIRSLFSQGYDESTFLQLEELFYEADLGAHLSQELVDKLRKHLKKHPGLEISQILSFVKEDLRSLFTPAPLMDMTPPHVILLVGVNGSGKTTSSAKLAHWYQKLGKRTLLVAADTFRAAALEQLQAWSRKTQVDLIQSQPQSDPSGVIFDALSAAKARNIDCVVIDTAGRLQTKTDLMQELAKLRRVCNKQIPGSPHETLLVLDATSGQNALDQAAKFHEATPLTGLVLTKLDGSAKGGIALALQKEQAIPIRWVGLGEKEADLSPFDPDPYLEALFS